MMMFIGGLFVGAGLGVLMMCVLAMSRDDVEPKFLRDE